MSQAIALEKASRSRTETETGVPVGQEQVASEGGGASQDETWTYVTDRQRAARNIIKQAENQTEAVENTYLGVWQL